MFSASPSLICKIASKALRKFRIVRYNGRQPLCLYMEKYPRG